MKKIFIFIIYLVPLVLLSAKVGDKIRVGNDFYMFVREIKGVKENSIFQQNVVIMMRYADALRGAKKQLEDKSLSKENKEMLEMKIKEIEDLYMSNNKLMIKQYNFAVERQYRQDYDDLFISTYLTDTEVDSLKLSDGSDVDIDKVVEDASRKVYRQLRVQGVENVRKFQREILSFVNRQAELKELQEQLLKEEDPIEKNNISTKITNLNNSLDETKKLLENDYSMNPNRDYFIELNNCKLYLLMTPQELMSEKK